MPTLSNSLRYLVFLYVLVGCFYTTITHAHEVRPAYLEIKQLGDEQFAVMWKQPVRGRQRLKIDPIFPDACSPSDATTQITNGALVSRWQITCSLQEGAIRVEGLNRSLTDVFIRLNFLDGSTRSSVLRPGASQLALEGPATAATSAYFILGVEHIIFGYDHLLFVLGLFLLVRRNQLVATITAFTVAHSITLGMAALAGWSLPSQPVEIVIAMSICLLGLEALYRTNGRDTLSAQYPWSIAFGFGLIHGFGFAGALADIGLPKGTEVWALFLFNIGVEAGQLAFVGFLILAGYLYNRINTISVQTVRVAACYGLGIVGAFWTIERFANSYL